MMQPWGRTGDATNADATTDGLEMKKRNETTTIRGGDSVGRTAKGTNECVMSMTGLLIRPGSIKGSGGNAGMLCPRAPPELPNLVVTLAEDGRGEAEMPPPSLINLTVRVKAVSAKHRILTGLSRLATSRVVP